MTVTPGGRWLISSQWGATATPGLQGNIEDQQSKLTCCPFTSRVSNKIRRKKYSWTFKQLNPFDICQTFLIISLTYMLDFFILKVFWIKRKNKIFPEKFLCRKATFPFSSDKGGSERWSITLIVYFLKNPPPPFVIIFISTFLSDIQHWI